MGGMFESIIFRLALNQLVGSFHPPLALFHRRHIDPSLAQLPAHVLERSVVRTGTFMNKQDNPPVAPVSPAMNRSVRPGWKMYDI